MSRVFKRGEVYWSALDPVRGAEIAKTRPCVVISASTINAARKTIVILPLSTTKNPTAWPLLIDVPSVGASSKARMEQLRCVDKNRLGEYIDSVSEADMQEIERALKQVLVLD
jgi:mRNA interferase MazF